jgi:acyl carrier protein|tara:strand:+ start:225 stop:473 length:249 start_codon:yes stop_codon:yes gene_type:complete
MLNIGERVEDITAKALHIDRNLVKQSSNFSLDLGADSLDVIELVMCLEETFDIDIPDTDSDTIFTVEEATTYIQEKVALYNE